MKILVTGASGGIGSLLSESLINSKHTVFMLDNFRNSSEFNLHSMNLTTATLLNIDICDPDLYNKIPSNLDCIVHLAAMTSLPECQSLPLEALSINVGGTLNLLEAAKKTGCKHFVFGSTSAVYENNKEKIFTENLTVHPTLMYSSSKKMAEDLCHSYNDKYGMSVTIARLFNVFGPNQDINRPNPPLLNYLVREFLAGRTPFVHSDGTQRRDYISVFDVIEFIAISLEIKPNGVFNVCSSEPKSVNEIIKIVRDTLGSKLDVEYRKATKLWDTYPDLFTGYYPLKKEAVEQETRKFSLGSNEKAKQILQWTPTSDLNHQISKSVLSIKKRLESG